MFQFLLLLLMAWFGVYSLESAGFLPSISASAAERDVSADKAADDGSSEGSSPSFFGSGEERGSAEGEKKGAKRGVKAASSEVAESDKPSADAEFLAPGMENESPAVAETPKTTPTDVVYGVAKGVELTGKAMVSAAHFVQHVSMNRQAGAHSAGVADSSVSEPSAGDEAAEASVSERGGGERMTDRIVRKAAARQGAE